MSRIYPEYYQYQERFVHPQLRQYIPYIRDVDRLFSMNLDLSKIGETIAHDIFKFPLFTEEFCKYLIEEVEKQRATLFSSMYPEEEGKEQEGIISTYGFNYGLATGLNRYIQQHVLPLIRAYYHKFLGYASWPIIFQQKPGSAVLIKDTSSMRDHHCLDADVVVYVALNEAFSGGGLYFKRQGFLLGDSCCLKAGEAVLFPGRVTHPHRVEPITSGNRYNLYYAITDRDGAEWINPKFVFE